MTIPILDIKKPSLREKFAPKPARLLSGEGEKKGMSHEEQDLKV